MKSWRNKSCNFWQWNKNENKIVRIRSDKKSMLKADRRRGLPATIPQLKAQWERGIRDEPRISRASRGATTGAGAGRSWRPRRAWWAWRARRARRSWRARRALATRWARRARPRWPRARLCSSPLFLPPLCAHLLLANHPVERLQRILLCGPTTQFPTLLSTSRAVEVDHSDRRRSSRRLMKIFVNPFRGADFVAQMMSLKWWTGGSKKPLPIRWWIFNAGRRRLIGIWWKSIVEWWSWPTHRRRSVSSKRRPVKVMQDNDKVEY